MSEMIERESWFSMVEIFMSLLRLELALWTEDVDVVILSKHETLPTQHFMVCSEDSSKEPGNFGDPLNLGQYDIDMRPPSTVSVRGSIVTTCDYPESHPFEFERRRTVQFRQVSYVTRMTQNEKDDLTVRCGKCKQSNNQCRSPTQREVNKSQEHS